MPLGSCKMQAPTWNSDTDRPPFPTFAFQFERFVCYQEAGVLIELSDHLIGKKRDSYSTSGLSTGALLKEEDEGDAEVPARYVSTLAPRSCAL